MLIGYARVSTQDQNLSLQIEALTRAGCGTIYQEHASGKNTGRPELSSCLRALREGDTLVIWRLDRLSRSLRDLIDVVSRLEAEGVQLLSLSEKLDTSSAAGKLVFHVFAVLAEFERNLIRERTQAGLSSARARGRLGGAPPKTSRKQDQQMRTLWDSGEHTAAEIAAQFNISPATFFRRMARLDKPAWQPKPAKAQV